MPSLLPVLILVSGSPGSGKTTLARRLADALALPHLNKDRIRDGMRFTGGLGTTNESLVWEVFYETLGRWLGNGVSIVTDFTTYAGETEKELLVRVDGKMAGVNIHCRAENGLSRFANRMKHHPQIPYSESQWAAQVEKARGVTAASNNPLPLGWPVLEVGTAEDYDPNFETLCDWVLHQVGRTIPLAVPGTSGG